MPGSPLQHGMDLPRSGERRAECIQAELAAVDVLPHRVVDTSDDAGHFEDLAGDLGGHDIPVVPVGQRGKAVRRLDPGLSKHVFVDPVAEHHLAGEVAPEPVEGAPVAIDDGDLVAVFGEGDGCHGAHAAATNDDELHEVKPHSRHYRPSASRAASISGSPASPILAWVAGSPAPRILSWFAGMSYPTRWKRTAGVARATMAKAASGLPSRGWPTLPGLTRAAGGSAIHSPGSGTCSPSSVKIRGRCVCPKKQRRRPSRTRISRAWRSSRMYSQREGLRGVRWT